MKKIANLQLLIPILSLLFCCSISSLNGQSEEKKINVMKICAESGSGVNYPGCTPGSYFTELNSNCEGTIYPNIYLTNVHESPILGESYPVPSYLPPVYIQHEKYEENMELSGPYPEAKYIGTALSASGEMVDVFAIELELKVVYDRGTCKEGGPNAVNNFIRQIEMVTPGKTGNSFDLFPIHKYSEPDQAFSCMDFYDTWCDCHETYFNGDPCEEDPIEPAYDLLVCILCGSCGEDRPYEPHPLPYVQEQARKSNSEAEQLTSVQVTPNPFDQLINFSFHAATDGPLHYSVYDATGRRILQEQQNITTGAYQSSINSGHLSSGIYYLHIQHGQTQSIQKLVKL